MHLQKNVQYINLIYIIFYLFLTSVFTLDVSNEESHLTFGSFFISVA